MSLSLAPPRTRRRRTVVAVTTVVGLVGIALPSYAWYGASAKSPTPPWLDTSKSVSARVNALMKEMTLAEKVGQMDQQLVDQLTDTDGNRCGDNGFNLPNPDCMQKILIEQKTGSILAGGHQQSRSTPPARAVSAIPATTGPTSTTSSRSTPSRIPGCISR